MQNAKEGGAPVHRIRIKRGLVALLALILVATAGISALSVAAAPDEGGRVPYQFRIDDLNGKDVGGIRIAPAVICGNQTVSAP